MPLRRQDGRGIHRRQALPSRCRQCHKQPMQALNYSELTAIGLALALGLLIGVQRGWASRTGAAGSRFAGIRTHALFGLAGGIAGALQHRAAAFAAVLLAASAVLVVMGYWRSTKGRASISGTASAMAGSTVLILSQRSRLHHLLRHIEEAEMTAIARFALIALVILPLLRIHRSGHTEPGTRASCGWWWCWFRASRSPVTPGSNCSARPAECWLPPLRDQWFPPLQ
jgi:hypothetical protein